ncbi:MAG TPA: aldehyde dehydrogenase [Pseudonocardia sp.]|jgi:acyl-CoA reductase-like NAD-dependent aldehyde dehydrogenase
MLVQDSLYIGGRWVAPTDPRSLDIVSPHDRSVIGRAVQAVPADVDAAVACARAAFDSGSWSGVAPAERILVLQRLDERRAARGDEIAELITRENGSALWFTRAGQAGLSVQARAYLTAATHFDWETTASPSTPGLPFRTVVRRAPVGVAAAVIPWNSPFSAAYAKLFPALLAGNTVVLKVCGENSLSMHLLAELLDESGLPRGVVSVLPADRATSEHLISHPEVDKIGFTGSTGAGRKIAAIAGQQLKRVSLELGGKSAALVLPDADLATVVEGIKRTSLLNNGEACIAHTRILVHRDRYDETVAHIAAMVAALPVGDPQDPDTYIGPMARPDQQQRVRDYIEIGIAEGARLATGGPHIPKGLEGGNYVTPTVFADVDNTMRIAQEEIFGPVLVVIPYSDEDDAIRLANDSDYGLSGGVWSTDPDHALTVARRIRTGTVGINGQPTSFDGPFGGFKASGIGREYGAAGIAAYTELQTITM